MAVSFYTIYLKTTNHNFARTGKMTAPSFYARLQRVTHSGSVRLAMTLSIIIFIFGLIIGSFINVCIYRLPRRESVVFPASHCPSCQGPIRFYDNIPLIGFLNLRGRCRACHAAISKQYPLVEAIHAIGYLFIFHHFGYTIETVIYALFFSALLVITFIDIAHQIIPDRITLPGIPLCFALASTVLPLGPMQAGLGFVVGGGLFYLIAILSTTLLKKEGMGGGDIKLVAMIGALLGWQKVLLTVFAASLLGSIIGLSLILCRVTSRRDPIPFGPFLAVGALIALFWGDHMLNWYFDAS